MARAEISADKINQPIEELAPKGGKGKQVAIPKVPLLYACICVEVTSSVNKPVID